MVLQGKLCGRVGRRRELFTAPNQQTVGSGLFFALLAHPMDAAAVEHALLAGGDL